MGTASAQNDIITVLQTPLASLTKISADNVVYINDAYAPTEGTPHIQAFMLFSEPIPASLGTSGYDRYEGIFQIDVHVPVNEGRSTLNDILKEIRGVYKRGTTLTNANISVECKRAWESVSYSGEGWYVVPLNIRWYAYANN